MAQALLPQAVASSVRKLAESMLSDKLKIKKQEEKIQVEMAKLQDMESNLTDTDSIIKKKANGYGFDDLFDIRTVESTNEETGKVTRANKIFWKFPESYLPEQATKQEETDTIQEFI